MELSIQEWDDSAAVKLPAALLAQLKLALGDKLVVDVRPDGIMLKPARPSYTLEELIAQCDPDAAMPADMKPGRKCRLLDVNHGEALGLPAWRL